MADYSWINVPEALQRRVNTQVVVEANILLEELDLKF